MPLMKLTEPVPAPEDFVSEIARAVAPKATLKARGENGLQAAYDGNRLVAFIKPRTHDSRVFPYLETLTPGYGLADQAKTTAARIIREASLFAKDSTTVEPRAPVILLGSMRSREGGRSSPAEYLAYIRFQRRVDEAPVFGPGTRAMIAVAADGSLRCLAHRWRAAMPTKDAVAPHSRRAIAESIRAQLATLPKTSEVTVDRVIVGYYDAGRDFLQPVYRFTATVAAPHERQSAPRQVLGYVSVGAGPEPLPTLGRKQGKVPIEPPSDRPNGPSPRVAPLNDPTVGRYVVRDDSDEWVTSAVEFLEGLQSAQDNGGTIPFTDSQYYWAYPWEFLALKNSYVNSVNIALNEVHGNWGWFSTRDNSDDVVKLNTIDGYGAGAGGSLAYWVIHSCEVIPTQTDEPTSFDVWWEIFNGLHAVVGYRTKNYIDDDVTGPFGYDIGLGAPVVSAWLSEVAASDAYDDGDIYFDGNRSMKEPMGRPSAVAVCRHGDDTAGDVGPLGRATCLSEWWLENWQAFLLQAGTPIGAEDAARNFTFAVGDYDGDGTPDVYCFKRTNTGSGTLEVHVLNGADDYQSFLVQTSTPIGAQDAANFIFAVGDYDGDGTPDVYCFKRTNTGSGTLEVHVLNGALI